MDRTVVERRAVLLSDSSMLVASGIDEESGKFLFSAFMFRIGLALVTFAQVRPLGMMFADYFFFASVLILLPSFRSVIRQAKGSGILPGGGLVIIRRSLIPLGGLG